VTDKQLEKSQEVEEMRMAVAKVNRNILQYYAQETQDNSQDLVVNLQKFFEKNSIDFYSELLDIAHPTLTPYLFGTEAAAMVSSHIGGFNLATTINQIRQQMGVTVSSLITALEQRYEACKTDEIISFKRREEISELLKEQLLKQTLNNDNLDYVLSMKFKDQVNSLIDEYEFAGVTSSMSADEGSGGVQAESESDEEEPEYLKVSSLMRSLREGLKLWQLSLIDYCHLLMPSTHQILLKDILEDEKSIKLEKYLLLSKKYFPVFKKMFPEIGAYELSLIARNCQPATDQIKLEGILPIFEKMAVAIIGDAELQDTRIIDSELIKLKTPVRHVSLGFAYKSVMQTFPLIFPDEIEHMPKMDVEIGIKLFNTKGGYLQAESNNGEIEQQHINSRYIDSDELLRFTGEKKYLATKEICNLLGSPYLSGWSKFSLTGQIQTDISITFIADKPYPASILKIYAKAKVLPNCKG
jgi:hypothetical protein